MPWASEMASPPTVPTTAPSTAPIFVKSNSTSCIVVIVTVWDSGATCLVGEGEGQLGDDEVLLAAAPRHRLQTHLHTRVEQRRVEPD